MIYISRRWHCQLLACGPRNCARQVNHRSTAWLIEPTLPSGGLPDLALGLDATLIFATRVTSCRQSVAGREQKTSPTWLLFEGCNDQCSLRCTRALWTRLCRCCCWCMRISHLVSSGTSCRCLEAAPALTRPQKPLRQTCNKALTKETRFTPLRETDLGSTVSWACRDRDFTGCWRHLRQTRCASAGMRRPISGTRLKKYILPKCCFFTPWSVCKLYVPYLYVSSNDLPTENFAIPYAPPAFAR